MLLNLILVLIILTLFLLMLVREGFQDLLPISNLITEEKVKCKGSQGEKGPDGQDGVVLTQ
jgi:hypothetical protein